MSRLQDNEMPCDCCGAETGATVWEGETDDIGDKGMFLCPACRLMTVSDRFHLMLAGENLRLS